MLLALYAAVVETTTRAAKQGERLSSNEAGHSNVQALTRKQEVAWLVIFMVLGDCRAFLRGNSSSPLCLWMWVWGCREMEHR